MGLATIYFHPFFSAKLTADSELLNVNWGEWKEPKGGDMKKMRKSVDIVVEKRQRKKGGSTQGRCEEAGRNKFN